MSDLTVNVDGMQGVKFIESIALTNPGIFFLLKHWLAILFVLLSIATAGIWQYNKFISKKLDKVNSELVEYRQKYKTLTDTYAFLQNEVTSARKDIDKFNQDVSLIKRENVAIREKIGQIHYSADSTITETQKQLDTIRKEIDEKWKNL